MIQMAKIYEFAIDTPTGAQLMSGGELCTSVYEKHRESYGETGAKKTRDAARRVLGSALAQYSDEKRCNNVLLVGKVQSGKTSNLEALVALACDNGFDLIVMYGGYDNSLLGQTVRRFRETFDCPKQADDLYDPADMDTPIVFTTDDTDEFCINNIDAATLKEYVEEGVPIFIITIKGATRLNQINKKLEELRHAGPRVLIIDDEGDQASLNNVKDKLNDASATYAAICNMKRILDDPIYFSVTATPMPNIFLSDLSELRPGAIHLLEPAAGYCGADVYHLSDNDNIIAIPDEMDAAIEDNRSPDSLRAAIRHFILASAILRLRASGKKRLRTQMVIHSVREVAIHEIIFRWVIQYIDEMRCIVDDALDSDLDDARILFLDTYESCFSDETKREIPFDRRLVEGVRTVLKRCTALMQNGQDQGTRSRARLKSHRIYIGAQLLERGITFDHLLTTYFTRWPRSGGNMDTNLQRARWFGYRSSYFDLVRLFTTEEIADEFAFLGEMEDRLWQQFAEVEEGNQSISDVVILAEGTRQKPTRRSVADFCQVFADDWIKQSLRATEPSDIEHNNRVIDDFLSSLSFEPRSYGRVDNEPTCYEAVASGAAVADLIMSLHGVLDDKMFRCREIELTLRKQSAVSVLRMMPEEPRVRSFYNADMKGRIKALHQGRSADYVTYRGDIAVVNDSLPASVQIHRILPKVGKETLPEQTQYMFAIFRRDNRQRGFVGAS